MAHCLSLTDDSSNIVMQSALYADGYNVNGYDVTVDGLFDDCDYIAVTQTELSQYTAYAWDNQFDAEAYDVAFGGVIEMWVIGLGIGLVLAIVSRLKR
jgi:hypothetical protein